MLIAKRGEDAYISKLNDDAVQYIREHYIPYDKEFGTRGLGRKFNVDQETIRSIIKNETWIHDD